MKPQLRLSLILHLRWHAVPLLLAAGFGLHTPTASACSCDVQSEVSPRSTDGVLPQDTRVWIPRLVAEMRAREEDLLIDPEGTSPTAEQVATLFALNDANSNAVAFSVTPIVDGQDRDVYFMLTPDEPLAPGEYQVFGTEETFTIGAEPAATPPAPPKIGSRHSSSESGTGSSCGESRAEHFEFVAGAPLLLAAANMEPVTDGENWHASTLTTDDFVSVGRTACGTIDWNFDDGPVDVRFARLNFSGQISGWTKPQRVFVEAPGFGCTLVGRPDEPPHSLLWVYALSGLVLARRARRRD